MADADSKDSDILSSIFSVTHSKHNSLFQAAATTVRETYGYLNFLVNTSAILSAPNLLHPGNLITAFQSCNAISEI